MIPKVNGSHIGKEGRYHLPEILKLKNEQFHEWCVDAFCQRTGRKYQTAESGEDINIVKDTSLPEEGYRVKVVENSIEITAATEKGVVWALTTLYQLLKNACIECCEIVDSPQFGYRGLSLDCVRHFFDVDEVKRVIEEISLVKMNVLHWQLGNDQGFRIETDQFPQLHTQSGKFYTKTDIQDVVKYASIRGVEIIPEIDMPGHTTAILAAYPQYGCKGEQVAIATSGGVYPIVLCPGKDEVFDFLKSLLDEIVPLFPGKWFHIGGDEAPDWEWADCPHCRARMTQLGLTKPRQLQGYFSGRVREMLLSHHKDVICWCDSLEAENFDWRDTPKQKMLVQYWGIQYADRVQAFLADGGRMIYSDMFELYLDYPSAMSSMKKIYHSKPAIRNSEYPEAAGMEACLWTEYVSTNELLESRLFPRVYAFAENAWCRETNYEDFLNRISRLIENSRKRGIHCQSAEEADPRGEAKKQGIMEYTAIMQAGMSPEMRELAVRFTKPNEEFNARFMQKFFGVE